MDEWMSDWVDREEGQLCLTTECQLINVEGEKALGHHHLATSVIKIDLVKKYQEPKYENRIFEKPQYILQQDNNEGEGE